MRNKVGASVVIYQNDVELKTWNARLPGKCAVFQAELKALRQGVIMLSTLLKWGDNISIFSDSSTALGTVSGCNESYKDAVWLWHKMVKLMVKGHHLQLEWIKAHVGHQGNERADSLVKQFISEEQHNKLIISQLARTLDNRQLWMINLPRNQQHSK